MKGTHGDDSSVSQRGVACETRVCQERGSVRELKCGGWQRRITKEGVVA